REEGEPHGLVRVRRQGGLELPDRALLVARLEAVEVALVRLEVPDASLHRVIAVAAGRDRLAGDDVAEVAVARYFQPHPSRTADIVDQGERGDPVRGRVAGQPPLAEAAPAQ